MDDPGDARPDKAAEVLAVLTLLLTPGLGRVKLRAGLGHFGSAAAAAASADWSRVPGVGERAAGNLGRALAATRAAGRAEAELAAAAAVGAEAVLLEDLPFALQRTPDAPPLLFVRGRFVVEDALAVGVVGSRACSAYGREQAARFAAHAADAGMTVVSGGARGIDGEAHRAVLRRLELGGRGRTVAVLGSGLGKPYPAEHAGMFEEIVDRGGVVCSELPVGTPPSKQSFPARNRIISGLSLGILVVEAADRSGASITARLASDEHGRVVMAIPGRLSDPSSAGCHRMIREGATLVSSPPEMLDALGEAGQRLQEELEARGDLAPDASADAEPIAVASLTELQKRVVAALPERGGAGVDALAAATGLPAASLFGELTVLELRGVITKSSAGFRQRG
ncbi:DNA-processing protein DprA [Phycisphaera mikurensis]|uniref:Putative DNA processing protein n=1 Tax=Phycisphaera mikurensis (strain NBRC 102666 / KCTC 22515 / FYK2301M01) TaxID=1142394 RepID=I0ICF0_PHYMF|nr:DNA-processing protein DprA [Phycisphaera mikurensis]MBB6442185.1 DNA processing protein [Phycisphaera mikurensis]BAM02938.1 putative DNA processing protein [Phycisphaera mikurensis NBRC 102666]